MSHTPGPWKYGDNKRRFIVFNPNIGTICSIGTDMIDQEDNARLIAAAPALLEAARELVRELGGFQNIIQCDSFNKLRAAIAAAGK